MSVKVTGLQDLLFDLEKRFGQDVVRRISDKALIDGANVFLKELKVQFEKFKDTGASIDEITLSAPMWIKGEGVRAVKVYWEGESERYRVIHLNEFGTVQNPSPDGKGAIARAIRNSEEAYYNAITDAIKRGL